MSDIKILVLGATGMLSWQVYDYLSRQAGYDVYGTTRRFDMKDKNIYKGIGAWDLRQCADQGYDYVINCIGVIKPYIKDNDSKSIDQAIHINSLLPYQIKETFFPTKVIHASTDCVFSGNDGDYDENDPTDAYDFYGKTKALGECPDNMNLRTSIVGHEKRGKKSLLEWFLSQPNGAELNGFANHWWNGMTTLQWAKCVEQIIDGDLWEPGNFHLFSTFNDGKYNDICKYDLLKEFKKAYDRDVKINSVNNPENSCDRSLITHKGLAINLEIPSFEVQLEEMKEWWNKYGD